MEVLMRINAFRKTKAILGKRKVCCIYLKKEKNIQTGLLLFNSKCRFG